MFKKSFKLILSAIVIFSMTFGPLGVILVQAASWSMSENAVGSAGGMAIQTSDKITQGQLEKINAANEKNWLKKFIEDIKNKAWDKAASVAFWMALRSVLNQIAYDTASWIGSGGKGQRPMFITEGWGEYLANIGDNAAGLFVESLGVELGWEDLNLCNPGLAIKAKIGLGLVDNYKPMRAKCTFSQMKNNWQAALSSDNFFSNLQAAFDPTESTLIQALSINTYFWGTIDLTKEVEGLDRIENEGWLDISGIAGTRENPPGHARSKLEQAKRIREASFSENTEDAFEDAINIFLNKLAVELFNRLLESLGKKSKKYTSPYDWSNINFGGDYYSEYDFGGQDAAQQRFNKLVEPNFNERGDYDILAELSMCPNPDKAGPTNCVITEEFKSAIENNMTVGRAMREGYLDPNAIFGFNSNGIEPLYHEGYPYRSMVILRKFRILPVGWEIGAQYIKENQLPALGAKNLEYMVNCFSDWDDYGSGSYPAWCKGYVDPSWVLKAPLNYCERSGPGPEILYESVVGKGDNSELVINRNDDYCADEKTCIKEDNGICRLYGYCTEERRGWDFNSDSCEPEYNTCQDFKTYDGKTIGYLENTLNYHICSVDNVGCREYCEDYNYNASQYECTDTTGNKIYMDRDTEECSDDAEGCSEFIRTKPAAGTNLFYDSSFETYYGWSTYPKMIRICDDGDVAYGKCSLNMTADIAPETVSLFAGSNKSIGGEGFTFSLYAKNCGQDGYISIGGKENWDVNHSTTTLFTGDTWQRFSVSHIMIPTTKEVQISIEGITNNGNCTINDCCRIDSVKVERGNSASTYNDYDNNDKVYMKILPEYLEDKCYISSGNTNFVDDRPKICDDFNRKCNETEWGCELYTSNRNKLSVPAIVKASDYCSKECIAYDEYMQMESSFESQNIQYFIPKTARKCGAGSEGCSEFTNLDTIEEGGENREYYIDLKRCIRPDDPAATCSEFYTWEGSSETGFQLKIHIMQVDEDGDDNVNVDGMYVGDPDVVEGDQLFCNESIYNLPAIDPAYNEDCLEYYNVAGEISYHLSKNTVSCTNNCHPYRKTDNNVVRDPVANNHLTQTQCEALSKYPGVWTDISRNFYLDGTPTNDQCVFCKANGVWNEEHGKCIYMAIPKEGRVCRAAEDGCREYSGSDGNNTRIIVNDDFEGSLNDWQAVGASTIMVDSESLLVGGESLKVIGGKIEKEVNAWTDRSYMLTFLAKRDISGTPATEFASIRFDASVFSSLPEKIGSDWAFYKFNLDLPVSAEKIIIEADGDFYIDNIRLTEVSGRYFLIKNSWETPDVCYNDIFGNFVGPIFNLGCDAYSDRAGDTHYLRNFSKLCQESAVGCELLIDTQNYSDFKEGIWNDIDSDGACTAVDGEDCEFVDGDALVFAVYSEDNSCGNSEKGCSRIGESYFYEDVILHKDKYLKNDPDKYNTILCREEGAGCDEWRTDEGISYFQDPGDQVCEWRQGVTEVFNAWAWYKKKVKKCDDGQGIGKVNGRIDISTSTVDIEESNICLADSDCASTGFVCEDDNDCRMQSCSAGGVCSATGESCSDNNDCPVLGSCVDSACHYSCIFDKNDYPCAVDVDFGVPGKTIGYGGKTGQPTKDSNGNWVGLCPISESGCSEYIDPISNSSPNEVFNGDFSQDVDGDGLADGFDIIPGNPKIALQKLYLDSEKFYVLSIDSDVAVDVDLKTTTGNNDFILFDEATNKFSSPVNHLTVVNPENGKGSIMFFTGENLFDPVEVSLIHLGTYVQTKLEIKEVSVGYAISKEVDRTSCNGGVNFDKGCVLFNERKVSGGNMYGVNYNSLFYDADNSPNESNGPEDCLTGGCDSNVILKVSPDRQCNKWLACKSYLLDRDGDPECFNVGLCSKMDNNGFCSSFVSDETPVEQIVGGLFNSIYKYQNAAGYVKIGRSGVSDQGMKGLYEFNKMKQEGSSTYVSNGGFEYVGENKYPLGWVVKDSAGGSVSWEDQQVRIVDNPEETQNEGISYNPEGKGFLKLGSSFMATSDSIDVVTDAEYFISGYINTTKFSRGQVKIKIIGAAGPGEISLDPGMDWTFKSLKFIAGKSTISIQLYAEGSLGGVPVGNFYFDDIRIGPALKVRDNTNVTKTCRLYPQTDSRTCEYMNDSGARERGWYGYCLEYDRFPGSEDACLVWWPVDRVQGEGVESSYGSLLQSPLYYCQEAVANVPVERRKIRIPANKVTWGDCKGECVTRALVRYNCPLGYKKVVELIDPGDCPSDGCGGLFGTGLFGTPGTPGTHSQCMPTCQAEGHMYIPEDNGEYGWYDYYNGLMDAVEIILEGDERNNTEVSITIPAEQGVRFYNAITNKLTDDMADCLQITQVVAPSGQNKFWSGRVYENSEYRVNDPVIPANSITDLNYYYNTPNSPFGAMMPPEPLTNPYEWSSETNRPVPVTVPIIAGEANAGYPYSITGNMTFLDSKLGICSGSRSLCLSSPSNDSQYVCKFGETCNTPFPVDDVTEAIENIKRLYAKNYGTWVWDEAIDRYVIQNNLTTYGGACTGDGSSCDYNECGALNCTIDNSAGLVSACEGGFMNGTDCVMDCAVNVDCLKSTWSADLYTCDGTFSGPRCCSGAWLPVVSCPGACEPRYDGSYRCIGTLDPCNPHFDGIGFMCSDLANGDYGNIAFQACASCTNTGTESSYDAYVCNTGSVSAADPLQICCPGGSCVTSSVYTCGDTTLANGGKRCYECPDVGHCVVASNIVAGSNLWGPPDALCPPVGRPLDSYCAIRPKITNVKANGQTADTDIDGDIDLDIMSGFKMINLTFNTDVDENQLPLVGYSINWGDDSSTNVSGIEIADKPSENNPHSLYHLYDYKSMRNNLNSCPPAGGFVNCCVTGSNYCLLQPKVQVKDNWGWCNSAAAINECIYWELGPIIRVYE